MDIANQVSGYATTYALDAWSIGGNFIAFGVLTIALLLFAMKGGRGAMISLIVSMYAGYAIYLVFPFTDLALALGGTALVKAVISVGLFVLASILPFHFIHRITSAGFGSLTIIPNFFLALLTAGFIFALGYHSFDVAQIYAFPEPIKTLFAPNEYFFWWFIAPLAGLIIFVH
ncbi:MAG: hypothetical protein ABA06_01775 [Parcubacteria bacterium C7867-001]|nr:MAG: hypothetical protein ABA06_01775 [Parcubacteria bacterium C7867-001]